MDRKISSGAKWESIVGYSRVVQVHNHIEVAGTTASQDGITLHTGDAYLQTKWILNKFDEVLKECGSSINDIVRTRIFVTDIKNWEAVGRAHGEYFSEIRPASTLVEVSGLVDPEMLVEIEATAIIRP